MKASALKYAVLTTMVWLISLIIALLPFHAFLSVWLASQLGHYTLLRLWKEYLLLICSLGAIYLLITDSKIRAQTLPRRLVWLIIAYSLVQMIWGAVALKYHSVNLKALGYGLIVNLRFGAFFLISWTVAARTARLKDHWPKLVLWPALIVVLFGLLQIFVLPLNFLSHFGYSAQTIPAYETINHNNLYVRIASTLRGANPLGAYLLIPLTTLAVLIIRGQRNLSKLLFLAGSLGVLFFSYSRSAWLGALASALVILLTHKWSPRTKRLLISTATALVVLVLLGSFMLRHSLVFQNIVSHTQQDSAVATTSDQGHSSALKAGLRDIIDQPLGRGPGTAGPASIFNNHPPRIAENYFLQIGQETGWLGLGLFLLINAGVGYILWLRRQDTLAVILLASLVGISLVNLLSHAWSDDTLAYVWWGLAGIAIGTSLDQVASNKREA